MTFPFVSEVNFEDGTSGSFTSETDTDSKLDFPHYSELARTPGIAMPFRGAYAMRVDLSGGTNDAYLQEDTDWDMALAATQHWRFYLWVDPGLTMATTDEFIIWQLQSAGPISEAVLAINFTTANGFRIGIGETAATSFLDLPLGKWLAVEVSITLDDGASDDGTIDLWVDGGQATQVASLDQAAIIQGRIGAMGIDVGTTAGVILFDQVLSDDGRIYPIADRFPETVLSTTDQHVLVGPGVIDNVTLMSGAAQDCVVSLFDTDTANVNDASKIVTELKNTANNEVVDPAGMPVRVRRGCYVVMTGTTPRSLVKFRQAQAWGSDGAIRTHAQGRRVGDL